MTTTLAAMRPLSEALETLELELLTHPQDQLTPGELKSLLMNVCLDARISKDQLPEVLVKKLDEVVLHEREAARQQPIINFRKDALLRCVKQVQSALATMAAG